MLVTGKKAGSRYQASKNSTCGSQMEYPVTINNLLNLSISNIHYKANQNAGEFFF